MAGFKELKVWQSAKELAVRIYRITQEGPFSGDFGLQDQIRRAAVSVPSNTRPATNEVQIRKLFGSSI